MSLLRRAATTENRHDLAAAFPGNVTGTVGWQSGMVWRGGTAMGTDTAMRLSAVFACLRLISEAISTLPLDTFAREGGERRPYPRPDYLTFSRHGESRIDYLSQLVLSLLTDGNAYVLTVRDRLGIIQQLIPLDPAAVSVSRTDGGAVHYEVAGKQVELGQNLMHIKGMCLPGHLCGVSPIGYARDSIGLGLAAQDFGKSFFENGALPGGVIEYDGPTEMSRKAAEGFAEWWNAGHQGTGKANRIGFLQNAKFSKVSINPDEAQFLETRAFQVPDIARIFGVPPHLIADASNSTSWGSGLAEQNLAFGQFSLRPWIERIEDAHTRLLASEGRDAFLKLNLDALLRASLADRYQSYAVGITHGFLTVNDVRRLEDEPPVPWGNGPTDGGESGEGGRALSAAEVAQKIYLAVQAGLITVAEGRQMLRDAGADIA